MKLFKILIALVLIVVGVGFYRGWFTLSRPAPVSGSDNVNINLETDVKKMKQDVQTVKDKATGLTGGTTDDIKADGPANDNVKSNER